AARGARRGHGGVAAGGGRGGGAARRGQSASRYSAWNSVRRAGCWSATGAWVISTDCTAGSSISKMKVGTRAPWLEGACPFGGGHVARADTPGRMRSSRHGRGGGRAQGRPVAVGGAVLPHPGPRGRRHRRRPRRGERGARQAREGGPPRRPSDGADRRDPVGAGGAEDG